MMVFEIIDSIKTPNNKLSSAIIKINKIKPFINRCKVTNVKETCNVEIEYVPNKKLIELNSWRDYFKKEFNDYLEVIALNVFEDIIKYINPKKIKVTIFLEDKKLTPWNVTFEKI